MPAATPRRCILIFCLVVAFTRRGLGASPKLTPTKADVSYGPHPHQLLDVYLPPEGKGPFPVVIWFGALGRQARAFRPFTHFSRHTARAVGVEARVMGDAIQAKITPPISVCLLDARRAVQFVRLHAPEWNLDPQRIAVAGSSQGALPASMSVVRGSVPIQPPAIPSSGFLRR